MSQYVISGMKSLMSTSPTAAVGVSTALASSSSPPSMQNASDWTYEKITQLPPHHLVEVLQSVPGRLEARTLSVETIVPALVKLCASNNAKVKALVCQIIVMVTGSGGQGVGGGGQGNSKAANDASDVGLLIVNILCQDLQDPNPENRATAVTTICSLPILTEGYAFKAISSGLKDSNPGVRKQAVIGCGKAWSHSPALVTESGLIDQLYTMIRDPDPTVLTFALQTLNIILKSEGGVVVNNNMIVYLLQRLEECPEIELVLLLNYLRLNRTKKEKDRAEMSLRMMNAVDVYLESKDGKMALAAMHLFADCIKTLILVDNKQHTIVKDFISKIKPQVSRFINVKGHSNDGFKIAMMDFVMDLPASAAELLTPILNDFHLKPKDSTEVAKAKLKTLAFIFRHTFNADLAAATVTTAAAATAAATATAATGNGDRNLVSPETPKADENLIPTPVDTRTLITEYLLKELKSVKGWAAKSSSSRTKADSLAVLDAIIATLCDLLKATRKVDQGGGRNPDFCSRVFRGFQELLTEDDTSHEPLEGNGGGGGSVSCLLWQHLHRERLEEHDFDFREEFATALCDTAVVRLVRTNQRPVSDNISTNQRPVSNNSTTNQEQVSPDNLELMRQVFHFVSCHPHLPMAPYYLEILVDSVPLFQGHNEDDRQGHAGDLLKLCVFEELFSATLKVTAKQPCPTQHVLVKVVSTCRQLRIPELSERIDISLKRLATQKSAPGSFKS